MAYQDQCHQQCIGAATIVFKSEGHTIIIQRLIQAFRFGSIRGNTSCKCKRTERSHALHSHFGGDDSGTAGLRITVDRKSTSDFRVLSENASA
jgi:hypothetical protein